MRNKHFRPKLNEVTVPSYHIEGFKCQKADVDTCCCAWMRDDFSKILMQRQPRAKSYDSDGAPRRAKFRETNKANIRKFETFWVE